MLIGILCLGLHFQAPADPRDWIHDGFRGPPELALRETLSPELQLAFDLALLVPERTSGIVIPEEMRAAAAARALEAWIEGGPGAREAEVEARLTGVIGAAGAQRLAEALHGESAVPGEDALASLLKSVPLADSAPSILAVALDREVHPSVRGDLAVHLILAFGRPALDALDPVLQPDEDDRLLRQLFTAWRTVVNLEDIPRLERIARESRGAAAQYGLQLWARIEPDAQRRLAIYDLALQAPGGYAALAIECLAEGGPDPIIANRLRSLLRAGSASQRGLALRALARFASHEAVLEEYRSLPEEPNVAAASWWMPVLAQSPLPESQEAAALWLARGGFTRGATALTVTRSLAGKDALLPMLGALLGDAEVPSSIRLAIAVASAEKSPDALQYLQEVARKGSGFEQHQAVRALGASGGLEDLEWFGVLARGVEFDIEVRAAALEMLVLRGAGDALLNEWLSSPPVEWELLEGLVRRAIEHGSPEQRDTALALARTGGGLSDPDSQRALRIASWSALADRGEIRGFALLAQECMELLERLEPEGRSAREDWKDLFDRLHDWPDIEGISTPARTLVAPISARPASMALRDWDPLLTSPEVLWVAAALWSSVDPEQAVAWLETLDALELSPANRVRVQGLRAARARQPLIERESLRQLLQSPALLRGHPLYLAQAFAPEGARWTLFHDKLAEREILADARCQPPAEALRRLSALESGYVEVDVLHRAARFAAGEPEGATVALRLAERGLALHPLHADLALLRAELLERTGRAQVASEAWRLVLRLAPPGYVQHEIARERLHALEEN